jgi:hypothetical protein
MPATVTGFPPKKNDRVTSDSTTRWQKFDTQENAWLSLYQFVNEVTAVFGIKHEYFVNWPVYSSLVIFSNRHFSLLLFHICADGSTHIQAVLFCTYYGLMSMLTNI